MYMCKHFNIATVCICLFMTISEVCNFSNIAHMMKVIGMYLVFLIQVIKMIDEGVRLPQPGCPRATYTIMIKCWLVSLLRRYCDTSYHKLRLLGHFFQCNNGDAIPLLVVDCIVLLYHT